MNITSNQKIQFSELEPLSLQIYEGGPPSAISGAVIEKARPHEPLGRNRGFDLNQLQSEEKIVLLPERVWSAKDQPDKGPVMLRTATQTSSKELA